MKFILCSFSSLFVTVAIAKHYNAVWVRRIVGFSGFSIFCIIYKSFHSETKLLWIMRVRACSKKITKYCSIENVNNGIIFIFKKVIPINIRTPWFSGSHKPCLFFAVLVPVTFTLPCQLNIRFSNQPGKKNGNCKNSTKPIPITANTLGLINSSWNISDN